MARASTKFICQKCSFESASWLGKCPNCGEWNSLVETVVSTRREKGKRKKEKVVSPLRFSEIKKEKLSRISVGIGEFDRVLGGGPPAGRAGIVPGSVILLAGEPGVGKSTLMLQVAERVKSEKALRSPTKILVAADRPETSGLITSSKNFVGSPRLLTLYVSGEESAQQLKLRAERLGIKGKNLVILEETNVEGIIEVIKDQSSISNKKSFSIGHSALIIIIDSIQTLYSEELTGAPGSIGQMRECSRKLFDLAKKSSIPMFLIGHITKEGTIAGPKTIEHLVDTVLYLEGERTTQLRILRSFKNRFGPTDEVGVFQMGEGGLEEIKNPSQFFLDEKAKKAPGSVVTVTIQGTRPLLTEVESLVVPTKLAFPRRVASGVSFPRLQVICAILQKLLRLPLGGFDIYTSISGGLKVTEPAVDLALALSIVSSFKGKPLLPHSAAIGELGLLGEIRGVPFLEKRIKEAEKLGFKTIITSSSYQNLSALVRKIFS